jgi:Fe-S cluster assembly protein SufB
LRRVRASTRIELGNWRTRIGRSKEGGTDVSSGHDTSREGPASDIEASVSQISAEQTFYMQQRGLSKGESMSLAVNGFVNDLASQFPMEYSVELKRLIDLEMEGSVG